MFDPNNDLVAVSAADCPRGRMTALRLMGEWLKQKFGTDGTDENLLRGKAQMRRFAEGESCEAFVRELGVRDPDFRRLDVVEVPK